MIFSVSQAWLCPAGLPMCVELHSHGFAPHVVLHGFFILNIIGIHACIFRVQSKVMPSNYVIGQLAHTNIHDAKNW